MDDDNNNMSSYNSNCFNTLFTGTNQNNNYV
jgi:hypothetical protein